MHNIMPKCEMWATDYVQWTFFSDANPCKSKFHSDFYIRVFSVRCMFSYRVLEQALEF